MLYYDTYRTIFDSSHLKIFNRADGGIADYSPTGILGSGILVCISDTEVLQYNTVHGPQYSSPRCHSVCSLTHCVCTGVFCHVHLRGTWYTVNGTASQCSARPSTQNTGLQGIQKHRKATTQAFIVHQHISTILRPHFATYVLRNNANVHR